jgi:cell division protease FtsH
MAEALLEHETIDGKHVMEILQFGEIRSPILPSVPPKVDGQTPPKKAADKAAAPEPMGPAAAPNPA